MGKLRATTRALRRAPRRSRAWALSVGTPTWVLLAAAVQDQTATDAIARFLSMAYAWTSRSIASGASRFTCRALGTGFLTCPLSEGT